MSTEHPVAPTVSQDNKTFPKFKENGHLILCLENPLLCLLANLQMSEIQTCFPLLIYL